MKKLSHLEVIWLIQGHPASSMILLSFLTLTPFNSVSVPLQHLSADYFLDLLLLYGISCAANYELVGLCQLVTPHH